MPSGPEWIIVLVIILVIFGGSQLPKLAKNLGKAQKEFKDGLTDGEREAAEAAKRREEALRRDAIDTPRIDTSRTETPRDD